MDKYDTLEYSRVKATAVSICLQIYLCAIKNTNTGEVGRLEHWHDTVRVALEASERETAAM